MYYYFDKKIPIVENDLLSAFERANYNVNASKYKEEIISKLKLDGIVYKKDLDKIKGYDKIQDTYPIISELLKSGQIEKEKQGRYVLYKLK